MVPLPNWRCSLQQTTVPLVGEGAGVSFAGRNRRLPDRALIVLGVLDGSEPLAGPRHSLPSELRVASYLRTQALPVAIRYATFEDWAATAGG